MLDVEFQGTVSSRMVTFLSSTIQMSGRAGVLIKDVGTVAGEDSTALWLGQSAKTFADGLNCSRKGSSWANTRS